MTNYKLTMEKSMNLKKRRLLEAFTNDIEPVVKISKIEPIIKVNQGTSTSDFEQLKSDLSILPTRILNLFEMKIKRLEQWELAKRQALEKLVQTIEELRLKEEEIEQKTALLEENKEQRRSTSATIKEFCEQNENNNTIPFAATPTIKVQTKKSQIDPNDKLIPIGQNSTLVPEKILHLINWNQPTAATRKLLMAIFDRDTLAFHTLTGKPSPAFMGCERPLKNQLDPLKVSDIIETVKKRSNAPERDIRSAITTKCADENKMYRQREKRKRKSCGIDAIGDEFRNQKKFFLSMETTRV